MSLAIRNGQLYVYYDGKRFLESTFRAMYPREYADAFGAN